MKRFFNMLGALCLFGALASTGAHAQSVANLKPSAQPTPDNEIGIRDLPEQLRPAAPLLSAADNVAFLSQVGSNNDSFIAQVGDQNLARLSIVGSGNTTAVLQDGNKNRFEMTVTGDNNPVSLTQLGDNNAYVMDLNASNTPVNLVQNGAGNRVSSSLTAINNRQYNISQYGNNNLLNQAEGRGATLAPQGYSVEMRGNGIRMTIDQGRVGP